MPASGGAGPQLPPWVARALPPKGSGSAGGSSAGGGPAGSGGGAGGGARPGGGAPLPGSGGAGLPAVRPWWDVWASSWTETSARLKEIKPPDFSRGLGFNGRLDIDIFNPMFTAIKTNWEQLPEPVRAVAPFLGTGMLVSALVGGLYREQLRLADARYDRLKREHVDMASKMSELERQVGGRTAAAREAALAEALAATATAAAAAATAAATAAGAAALPAYEPARVLALLQHYAGPAAFVPPAAPRPSRRGRRRKDAAAAPPQALPWWFGGGEGGAVREEEEEEEWQPPPLFFSSEEEDIASEWSGTAFTGSGEGRGTAVVAAAGGAAGRRRGGGGRERGRPGDHASGHGNSGGGGGGGLSPPSLDGVAKGVRGAAAAAAGALHDLPARAAQLPGWLGAQAGRARAGVEGLLRAVRGGGGGS
ncbi:hypothetical protein Rsub_09254 [Raphidocelis subcapitata]|uniref:Uncharacterized protein n=1 Tax=Raphidocelis subcapitata TaxID=307507 RepID=A0A2V0PHF0_9CHLO|nr:hypothetical protein Rsub_09254 [Raphidocelis subcapitata]|eukprot:GBF96455.1 hypothetical protein Rsub_09254 [Raphidocelis subcapitata]